MKNDVGCYPEGKVAVVQSVAAVVVKAEVDSNGSGDEAHSEDE